MSDEIRVILPAGAIPTGSTVTKRTSHKHPNRYTIVDQLKVYPYETKAERLHREDEGLPSGIQVIKGEAGVRFLVDQNASGNINSVPPTRELIWVTTYKELYKHLDAQLHPREDK